MLHEPLTRSRLRVSTGFVLTLILATVFTSTVSAAVLPQAHTAAYTTTTVLSCAEACEIVISPNANVLRLPAHGTKAIDLTGYVTLIGGFGSWTVSAGVEAEAVVHYDDGKTVSQFTAPPLSMHLSKVGDTGEIPRVVNSLDEHTSITTLNTSDSAAALTITVYDGENNEIAKETMLAPRGVNQAELLTEVAAGRVVITEGWPDKVGGGGVGDADVYVFAAIGPRSGKTQRIETLR
jgi:hypothetical protein